MKYKSGSFVVPGSTGSYPVTGVGFAPQGVFFFGSNAAGLDAVVAPGNIAVFGGMMGRHYLTSALLSHCVGFHPNPKGHEMTARPIHVRATPGSATPDYSATGTSLDSDGFTVNFTKVSSGTRYVHWLAWGEADHAGALKTTGVDTTLALGWRTKTLLTLGSFDNGDGESVQNGSHWAWWGSGCYPPSTLSWSGVYMTDVSLSQQRIAAVHSTGSPSTTDENYHGGIAGTILGGQLRARPTGGSLTDLFLDYVSAASVFDFHQFWDGNASQGGAVPSNVVGASVDINMDNTLVEDLAAVLLFGVGDTAGFGTTLIGNAGFGVCTEGHQACVFVDGSAQRLYQSITKGWCCDVQPGGATAGTITLGNRKYTLTTSVAGASARNMVYNAWGPQERRKLPQIYRLVLPGPGLHPPV